MKQIVLSIIGSMLVFSSAHAEVSLEAQGGLTFPARLHHFAGQYASEGLFSTSDLALQRGTTFGAKLTYYPHNDSYVGIEASWLHTSPKDKQQSYWITWNKPRLNTLGAVEPAVNVVVDSYSLHGLLRYPGKTWQPFIMVGPTLFLANYGGDPTLNHIGFDVGAGLKYNMTEHLFVSTSYLYQQSWLTFRESSGPNHSINGFFVFYQTQSLLFGLGYKFN